MEFSSDPRIFAADSRLANFEYASRTATGCTSSSMARYGTVYLLTRCGGVARITGLLSFVCTAPWVLPAAEVKASVVSTSEQNGKLGSPTKRHEAFVAIWKPRTRISQRQRVELMRAGAIKKQVNTITDP